MHQQTITRRSFCLRAARASFGIVLTGLNARANGSSGQHDVTIDLSDSNNAILNTIGGAMYVTVPSSGERVIVVRNSETEVSAFSSVCTHNGCRVALPVKGVATCPCHGSRFSDRGSVLRGPATTDLKLWYTSLDGNNLYIDTEPPSGVTAPQGQNDSATDFSVVQSRRNKTVLLSWRSNGMFPATVSLFDAKGKLINRTAWNTGAAISLPVDRLPGGSYYIRVKIDGRNPVSRTIQLF
jgi:Rieske Fe-S protein